VLHGVHHRRTASRSYAGAFSVRDLGPLVGGGCTGQGHFEGIDHLTSATLCLLGAMTTAALEPLRTQLRSVCSRWGLELGIR